MGSCPTRLLREVPRPGPTALGPLLPPTDILEARRTCQVQEFTQQMQKAKESWRSRRARGARHGQPGSPDPGPDTTAPGVPWGGCEEAEVGSRRRGVWARCLLCPPGSLPGCPSTGSCSLSPPTCALCTALKAQIILTTVPHCHLSCLENSPFLVAQREVSLALQQQHWALISRLNAGVAGAVGPRARVNTTPAAQQSLSYGSAGARSAEPSVPAANCNYLSACCSRRRA